MRSRFAGSAALSTVLAAWLVTGCHFGAAGYRREADEVATRIVEAAQREALGREEPFTIERPSDTLRRRLLLDQQLPHTGAASLGADQLEPVPHWPEEQYPARLAGGASVVPPWQDGRPLTLTLVQALQVAARNNRDYQTRKEDVFTSALDLDLEANQFRHLFFADAEARFDADLSGNEDVRGVTHTETVSWQRQLKNGTLLTAGLGMDLVKLLTQDRASALGLFADATVTIPLLRGAGRHIVSEPLTRAEREVVYSLYTFERFRRTLAVRVASEYLAVLQQLDQAENAEDNYRRLIESARRARRLANAGRLPKIQVDQARQDELRSRERWIAAQQMYARRLDTFKTTLGLPTDARIELDPAELTRLAEVASSAMHHAGADQATDTPPKPGDAPDADTPALLPPPSARGGPLEIPGEQAVGVALEHRLDLRTLLGRVFDAQRQVVVAADALKLGLKLEGTGQVGERRGLSSAAQDNARLSVDRGVYSLGLLLGVPLERTAERNAYRASLIDLEQATRAVQDLEDQVKLNVRDALRKLLEARESYRIQAQAVALAERRVASTGLFLQAGRAQIRDVLEAQESLVSARNARTAALVNYRVAELELQRDMGVLTVDEKGLWSEYRPE